MAKDYWTTRAVTSADELDRERRCVVGRMIKNFMPDRVPNTSIWRLDIHSEISKNGDGRLPLVDGAGPLHATEWEWTLKPDR